jgi:ParB family chromosome partitioning protein
MVKVKYREISKELLKIASPLDNPQNNFRSSANSTIDVIEHYRIDIEKLSPYRKQARREFNQQEIEGLAQSIREHGVRQPLTIIQSTQDETKYEVVSGERRLRAAKIAGLQKIPCIIISDASLAEEIALVENIQRQDLHPIELGEAFLKILETRKGLSQIALAEKLGISNKIVSEALQYANLPDDVKNVLVTQEIKGREFLRKLIKSDNPQALLKSSNFSDDNSKNSVRSVVRVSLKEGKFHMQASAINKLDKDKKKELKTLLNDLVSIL